MKRSFRDSRFNRRRTLGEDVNPNAYIVNLADCMLVLACGFMVALITYWNIDVTPSSVELQDEQLEQVDPETMPEDVVNGGSYYVEAGKVYQDPNTGQLYMVQDGEVSIAGEDGFEGAEGQDVPDESELKDASADLKDAE